MSRGNLAAARIANVKMNYADKWVHLTWSLKVTDASSPIKSEWTVWFNGVLTELEEADSTTVIAPSGVIADMPYPEMSPEKVFFRLEFIGHSAFELDDDVKNYFRGELTPLSCLNFSLSASSIFWRLHRHHLDTPLAPLNLSVRCKNFEFRHAFSAPWRNNLLFLPDFLHPVLGWVDTWRRFGQPLTDEDVQQIYLWDSQTLRFPFDDQLLDLSGNSQPDSDKGTHPLGMQRSLPAQMHGGGVAALQPCSSTNSVHMFFRAR